MLAAVLARAGLEAAAGGPMVVALVLAAGCRRSLRLAARSGVGARSEAEVHRALAGLEREGWRIRHSLRWHGGGDIDHVAIAPAPVLRL